jgi:ABC-type branched-subunit amino acid transport system permease subunit
MTEAPMWVPSVISLILGVFLPFGIKYVAKSSKSWINFLIAYGSSALLGGLSAWVAGSISEDIFASVLAAIVATQASYTAYWKPIIQKEAVVTGEIPTADPL